MANALREVTVRTMRYGLAALRGVGLLGSGTCRFEPSCSVYAEEAIRSRGIISGAALTIKRLSKCHPFGSGGFDPVPEDKVEK